MRLYKNALILVIILGLLTATYFLIKNMQKPEANNDDLNETPQTIELIKIDSKDIQQINLENFNGSVEFKLIDNKWVVVYPEGIVDFEQNMVDNIIDSISNLKAEKVIEEKTEQLWLYSLEEPSQVIIKLKDGTEKVLEIGSKTPTGDAYYAKLKDSLKVYSIDEYYAIPMLSGKNELLKKIIYTIEQTDVNSISMEKDGNIYFNAIKKEEEVWDLTEPIVNEADSGTIGFMIDSLLKVTIIDIVEDDAKDLSKYGLDVPSYAVEIGTAEGKIKILLGDEKEKNSEFYAKLAGENKVFTIGTANLGFLDIPLTEITERFVFLADIQKVTRLQVEFDGKTIVSDINTYPEDRDKDKFTVNGKDATMMDEDQNQPFRKFYGSVIGVTLSEIDTTGKPTGKAEITFTYTIKGQAKNTVIEYIPKNEYSYYAVKDGKYTGFVVEKKKFDEPEGLRDSYKKLEEAMNK